MMRKPSPNSANSITTEPLSHVVRRNRPSIVTPTACIFLNSVYSCIYCRTYLGLYNFSPVSATAALLCCCVAALQRGCYCNTTTTVLYAG